MEFKNTALYEVHLNWAKWTISVLRLRYPQIEAKLYKHDKGFAISVEYMPEELTQDIFHSSIRPVTCNIDLCLIPPTKSELIDDSLDCEMELWLYGQPIPVADLNQLLMLTSTQVPLGSVDFDNQKDEWVFTTDQDISEPQCDAVITGLKKIGYKGSVRFQSVSVLDEIKGSTTKVVGRYDEMRIVPSQVFHAQPALKNLVEADETNWRSFVIRHSEKNFNLPSRPNKFSCLFDTEDCSDIRLSELLCIYDQVNLIPKVHDNEWLLKHQLSLEDLQHLIQMGRVALVLPYSIDKYPQDIILAAAEVDFGALTLSRSLAVKTFEQGINKDPLLYSPLTSRERAIILGFLLENTTSKNFNIVLKGYSNLFQQQQLGFSTRGAGAVLGCGIGAHLGELIFTLKGLDARIELMTNGAALEWAMALGSSFIPRDFGGFDETKNSLLLASFIGKTPLRLMDPVAPRMHTAIDGLLSVSGIPPIEVARNFNSLSLLRFRNLATRIMTQQGKQADVENIVKCLNDDVRAFESKKAKLKEWKIDSLLVGGIAKPLGDAIDQQLGGFASVLSFWLMEVLKSKMPAVMNNEISTALDMLIGFSTGSPIDSVIVSRSRKSFNSL